MIAGREAPEPRVALQQPEGSLKLSITRLYFRLSNLRTGLVLEISCYKNRRGQARVEIRATIQPAFYHSAKYDSETKETDILNRLIKSHQVWATSHAA